jgi:predicted transcriptional regulator
MSKIDFLSFTSRKKISQTELSKILGVKQSSVSQYVSGKQGIVFDKIEKLVELGITPEELFGEKLGKKFREDIIKEHFENSKIDIDDDFEKRVAMAIVNIYNGGFLKLKEVI